jgi:hypothetical protein
MHVDTAHHIPVTDKPTDWVATAPNPPFHFLFPAAFRTLAARSPLRTSEALDAGCSRLIGEISDILAVLPPRQALIMVPSTIPSAYALWITYEQPTHLVLLTKRDNLAGALMA